jgi:hypothetical protein
MLSDIPKCRQTGIGEGKIAPGFLASHRNCRKCSAGLFARVSTNDQQTIPLQICDLREYATRRVWPIALHVKEVGLR